MGFPEKYAQPCLSVDKDTLIGTLNYGPVRVATGTMGFKHRAIDLAEVQRALEKPNYLLKIIPDVDGVPAYLRARRLSPRRHRYERRLDRSRYPRSQPACPGAGG